MALLPHTHETVRRGWQGETRTTEGGSLSVSVSAKILELLHQISMGLSHSRCRAAHQGNIPAPWCRFSGGNATLRCSGTSGTAPQRQC
jgi:hypothetical protein